MTRQWMSVPWRDLDALPAGEGSGGDRDRAPRQQAEDRPPLGQPVHPPPPRRRPRPRGGAADMARLDAEGLPNYFGPQRFGRRGDNADQGRAILKGKLTVRSRYHRQLCPSRRSSPSCSTTGSTGESTTAAWTRRLKATSSRSGPPEASSAATTRRRTRPGSRPASSTPAAPSSATRAGAPRGPRRRAGGGGPGPRGPDPGELPRRGPGRPGALAAPPGSPSRTLGLSPRATTWSSPSRCLLGPTPRWCWQSCRERAKSRPHGAPGQALPDGGGPLRPRRPRRRRDRVHRRALPDVRRRVTAPLPP